MKKIIIIGCPGSGKSTLARALHKATGLPLHHLDLMYWNSDRTTVEKEVFSERLEAVLSQDRWILDGNYGATMERRLTACDTVIFLDYPTELCLLGIELRRGQPRSDLPWTETEDDADFLEFIRNFQEQSRPKILALLQKYPEKNTFIFTCREQAEAFLGELR